MSFARPTQRERPRGITSSMRRAAILESPIPVAAPARRVFPGCPSPRWRYCCCSAPVARRKSAKRERVATLAEDIRDSPLFNPDLAPVPKSQRNWSTYNFAALWISMAHCIPTYMLAGGLVAVGMNWGEALLTIGLGNLIVLCPILLNAHPGTKYGIPFPVLARASFGTKGANVPAMLRAIVACGWVGIPTIIGGQAVRTFIEALWPGFASIGGGSTLLGLQVPSAITFLLFWTLNIWIIYRGMNAVRVFENWAAPIVLVMAAVLLGWAVSRANGLG